MSPSIVALLGFAALFLLIVLHVPLAIAMMIVGACGFAVLVGPEPASALFADDVASVLGSPDMAIIPLFLLMGSFAGAAGLSADLYRFANAFVGHWRGGLAMATIGGCAGFGAVCGSSLATVGTMVRVAHPEMLARGYAPHFSAGTIAVGGTLGLMIPPSIIMVLYAVLTETFVIDLYIGAIVPGLLAVLLYFVAIYWWARRHPVEAPRGSRSDWRARRKVASETGGVITMVVVVTGGMYGGIFTATEAAAIGAFVAFLFLVLRGRFDAREFWRMIVGVAATTGMIYMMVIGASVFNYFVAVSHVPEQLLGWITASNIPHLAILALILALYIVLGAVFDETATMLITLPFVLPLVIGFGYDAVWWGIVNVVVITIGLICPPIGLNVLVLAGLLRRIAVRKIYAGIVPFLAVDIVRLALLLLFPALVTWLPGTMR